MPQKKKVKKLADVLKQCRIAEPDLVSPQGTVLNKVADPALVKKWPKLKMKVPPLFLHKPVELTDHARPLLEQGVKFFQAHRGRQHTKINCPTFSDQRAMSSYFEKNHLPYHTYGHPNKRKFKVVVRGLPNNTDLNEVKSELLKMSIPVMRVHKMSTKESAKQPPLLVLVVVPYNDEGKKIFVVKKILGHDVKLEPPKPKLKQCHRCQKWGHSQRYCRGVVKCVKCAGDHFYKKCPRDASKEPPKCANCGKDHVASFRMCAHCPQSITHCVAAAIKFANRMRRGAPKEERQLVTLENIDNLYKNPTKKNVNVADLCGIVDDYDTDDNYEDYGIDYDDIVGDTDDDDGVMAFAL